MRFISSFLIVAAVASLAAANSDCLPAVKRGIFMHRSEFVACYTAAAATQPELRGKVLATFRVDTDGSVTDATATGLTTEIDECVATTIKKIQFPKISAAITISNYPFEFAPGKVITQPKQR